MKIEVAKEDLQNLRDLIWQGRAHYSRASVFSGTQPAMKLGTKTIKKINAALKKVHGHDCNGEAYL